MSKKYNFTTQPVEGFEEPPEEIKDAVIQLMTVFKQRPQGGNLRDRGDFIADLICKLRPHSIVIDPPKFMIRHIAFGLSYKHGKPLCMYFPTKWGLIDYWKSVWADT